MLIAEAMILEQFGQPLVRQRISVSALEPGSLVVRLRAAGICGSDLDIWAGRDPRVAVPLVPGHEGIGEIVTLNGPQKDIRGESLCEGDLVAFNRAITCGHCAYCTLRGQPELCAERKTYGISWGGDKTAVALRGCFAEMIVLHPATEIIKLPPEADPVALVAATCSGATAAHAVELCSIAPADVVVVFGPGPLGLYAAAFALQRGARHVIMIGRRYDQRLQLAEQLGCLPLSISATTFDERLAFVEGLTEGTGAQAVLDCAGTAESLQEAIALAAPGGTIAFPGVATPLPHFSCDPYILARKQICLQGVWTSNVRHLYQALQLALSGPPALKELVTNVLPMSEANKGLQLLREKKAIKVVLQPAM